MGVFIRKGKDGRPDSPFYQLWLEGHGIKEPTDIRHDAPTPAQRRENKLLADMRYHERMTELAKGAPGAKPARTFAEQAAWFEKHQLPRRRGREREGPLIPKVVTVFGPLPLVRVTRSLVTERWITPRLNIPTIVKKKRRTPARHLHAGPRTVNREVDLIKAILQSAVPDYLETSPLFGMPLLPTTTPRRRLMTPEEEARLLAVMAPDDKALFLLGLDSLIRLTDLLDAKRGDDHGATLWIADPKAGGGFEVPVSTRARAALDALTSEQSRGSARVLDRDGLRAALAREPRPTNVEIARQFGVSETAIRKFAKSPPPPASIFLFPRRRRARTERDRRNGIRQMLERYCEEAKVLYGKRNSGITFHWATRRTGLTRMLTRGVDLGTAQKIGRWKTPDVVLGVYHELIDEVAHAAVNVVGPTGIRRE